MNRIANIFIFLGTLLIILIIYFPSSNEPKYKDKVDFYTSTGDHFYFEGTYKEFFDQSDFESNLYEIKNNEKFLIKHEYTSNKLRNMYLREDIFNSKEDFKSFQYKYDKKMYTSHLINMNFILYKAENENRYNFIYIKDVLKNLEKYLFLAPVSQKYKQIMSERNLIISEY
ncbi:MAG: hypothetical protein N4A48_09585 [Tepidibacter sp.]|uniref:hypothetical protein n=1 Tax=Tepidibacter sp. TaxID=2529387 RepID=UPI0025DF6D4D|nr:hypothetical protein [Tepidibacter sp.]MCT4508996.1 hypothetical protein [Tepidibacter sp.]